MRRPESLLARTGLAGAPSVPDLVFACWSLVFWLGAPALSAQELNINETEAKPAATSSEDPPEPPSQSTHESANRSRYIALVRDQAKKMGLPADLAEAGADVESGYYPERIGAVGEIGLMQVRPETAVMLGFRGATEELAAPETNIRYGVAYLAQAWRLAEGNLCRALMKYRAGHGEERISLRSLEYCIHAKAYLARINSPLAMDFKAPSFLQNSTEAVIAKDREKRSHVAVVRKRFRSSEDFWAAHEARIRILTKLAHAKWKRFAAANARGE